jgi:capsular polysaccharide biosynthesis protein
MNQTEHNEEINLMEYLEVLWRRKWMIIIPTILISIAVGIWSFLQTPVWEVDALVQPSKFFVQAENGQFSEVLVVDPKQIASQINQQAYSGLLAAELNLNLRTLSAIKAENPKDTKLVRLWIRNSNIDRGIKILNALFHHLKSDFDKKIDVEIKGLDTKIASNENAIKQNELTIKDKFNEIKLLDIQKTKARQEISTAENRIKISEERAKNISEEMRSVKERINALEEQLKKTLGEQRQTGESIGLLLYMSYVQNNVQYYNTLDEKLSGEKNLQESLQLEIKGKTENLKEIDTQIEKFKNDADKISNTTENIKKQIELLVEQKTRIDYAQLIKDPTPSLAPVSPQKRKNVMIAGLFALIVFVFLAFFLDYLKKWKLEQRKK